ncbi:MAG: DUF3152 domain-containing protein [Actinomycetes bacterium]
MGIRATIFATVFLVGVTALVSPQSTGDALARAAAAQPTDLKLSVSERRVGPGEQFTISAELKLDADSSPVAGESVQLQWQRLGVSGWKDGGTATTGGQGRATWKQRTPESRRYRAVYDGTATFAASVSGVSKVTMKPVVTAKASRDWVRPDGTVTVRARVSPAYRAEFVTLQERDGGHWSDVKRKRQDAHGRASFTVGGRGQYGPQRYRVVLDRRDDHLGAQSSSVEVSTVRLVTYVIETRGKVRGALPAFRSRTAEIYADPRGWSRADVHFKRVKSGGAFSLVLSQAKYVPSFGSPCDRYWSCRVGRYVIINENRWRHGTPYFKSAGGTLRQYRAMVVDHETGHWFGLDHATCGGKGQLAPVMMQQSKGLYGCKPNAWPLPSEIARAF